MRRSLIVAAIAALLLIVSMAPAGATPPSGLQIENPVTFDPNNPFPSTGPFTASGPAVDDGTICGSGDSVDVFVKYSGFNRASGDGNALIVKRFTCDDGSGDFLVKLQVKLYFDVGTDFRWVIVGGSGAYSDLHGSGEGVGVPNGPPGYVLDLYAGKVHND
jgi:hypothetical protein